MEHNGNILKAIRLGIDTYHENIIFMREDCQVCRSEGFTALTRVEVSFNGKSIVATLNTITSNIIDHGEAALSNIAFDMLGVKEDDMISISHLSQRCAFENVWQQTG